MEMECVLASEEICHILTFLVLEDQLIRSPVVQQHISSCLTIDVCGMQPRAAVEIKFSESWRSNVLVSRKSELNCSGF
jgi:hypothetical protein